MDIGRPAWLVWHECGHSPAPGSRVVVRIRSTQPVKNSPSSPTRAVSIGNLSGLIVETWASLWAKNPRAKPASRSAARSRSRCLP